MAVKSPLSSQAASQAVLQGLRWRTEGKEEAGRARRPHLPPTRTPSRRSQIMLTLHLTTVATPSTLRMRPTRTTRKAPRATRYIAVRRTRPSAHSSLLSPAVTLDTRRLAHRSRIRRTPGRLTRPYQARRTDLALSRVRRSARQWHTGRAIFPSRTPTRRTLGRPEA